MAEKQLEPGMLLYNEINRSKAYTNSHLAMNLFAAGAANLITAPAEFIKVNCYIKGEGKWHPTVRHNDVMHQALAEGGLGRLFTGLDAILLRSCIFAGVRGLTYSYLTGNAARKDRYNSVSIWKKIWLSSIAGTVGAFASAPFDLAAVRMQTDATLPEAMQRKYTSGLNAVSRISSTEGFGALLTGLSPQIARCAAQTSAMMFMYDNCVEFWARVIGAIPGIKLFATIWATLFTCVFTTPFDNIKTKYQRMTAEGPIKYKSVSHCVMKTMANESFMGLYTGFWINLMKTGPTAYLTFTIINWTQPWFLGK